MSTSSLIHTGEQMQESIEHYPSLLPSTSAITLMAHGLNLKPAAMLPLIEWLTSRGSDVYLVRLSGHYTGGITINEVTSATWHTEMLTGYEKARHAARNLSVPLFFLGYSLGALLGQSMMVLSTQAVSFDKQVLFAPATAVRRRTNLLKLLFVFGKLRTVPSFAPMAYRVNDFLPLLVYDILFTEQRRVVTSRFKNANIPTLIFLDPRDELINGKELHKQTSRFGLKNYRVVLLPGNLKERNSRHHHLIIDEQTLGMRNWRLVTKEMEAFLFKHSG